MGIIRNHYVGRTFIEPKQEIRKLGVRLKHAANRAVIEGKRVILVDDSIVRGTTSAKIVQMVREAGAKEVHLRSASPPIKFPDFYGIDMPTKQQLLAATHTHDEMVKFLGVDLAWVFVSRRPLLGDGRRARSATAQIYRPLLHRRLSHRAGRSEGPTERIRITSSLFSSKRKAP